MTFATVTHHRFVWAGAGFVVHTRGTVREEITMAPVLTATVTGGRVTEWVLDKVPYQGASAAEMDQHLAVLTEARRMIRALQGDALSE